MSLTNGEIVVLSIGFWVIGLVLAHLRERYVWNNGLSPYSGRPWQYFDTASDSSRGYTDGEGNVIWINTNVDKQQEKTHVRG